MKTVVRLTTGPLPLTGLVLGETTTLDKQTPLLKVAVYGYNPDRPEYWRKADCIELAPEELKRRGIEIDGWLRLASGRF